MNNALKLECVVPSGWNVALVRIVKQNDDLIERGRFTFMSSDGFQMQSISSPNFDQAGDAETMPQFLFCLRGTDKKQDLNAFIIPTSCLAIVGAAVDKLNAYLNPQKKGCVAPIITIP